MATINIYQLPTGHPKLFDDGAGFLPEHTKVYSYESNNTDLEHIFTKFNIHHPADFTGHSLSVSDIVEIDGVKWQVEFIGWNKLS
jgi:hypothetical protein